MAKGKYWGFMLRDGERKAPRQKGLGTAIGDQGGHSTWSWVENQRVRA